jgi:dsRNA-specific ribonuclease
MVEVLIGEQVVGCGVGRSKRSAAQAAARAALHMLKQGSLVVSPNNN